MLRQQRLLLVVGLVAAVAMVALGFRFRVMLAGGKAVLVLAAIALLIWLALAPRRTGKG